MFSSVDSLSSSTATMTRGSRCSAITNKFLVSSLKASHPSSSSLISKEIYKYIICSYRKFYDICCEYSSSSSTTSITAMNDTRAASISLRDDLCNLKLSIDSILSSIQSSIQSNEQLNDLERLLNDIDVMERSWHLCEIFHINPREGYLSIDVAKWFYLSVLKPPYDEAIEYCKTIASPERLLSVNHPLFTGYSYWKLLFELAMHGLLGKAATLLLLHSEIRSIHSSKGNIESTIIDRLIELLHMHPYACDITDDEAIAVDGTAHDDMNSNDFIDDTDDTVYARRSSSSNRGVSSPKDISVKFKLWQELLVRLRNDIKCEHIIRLVPNLDVLFMILCGDISVLKGNCNNQWKSLSISLFLYKFPPPLTRGDVCKQVIERSIDMTSNTESSSSAAAAAVATDELNAFKSIMASGGEGSIIRSLSELGSNYSNSSFMRILSAFVTTHVTYLVNHRRNLKAFTTVLADSSYECSFMDSLLIDTAVVLNEAEYPLEVICHYVELIEKDALKAEFSQGLLASRSISTDADALLLSSCLRSLQLEKVARSVEVQRGMWWLTSKGTVSSRSSSCVSIAKAISFFQRAGDTSRILSLLDRAAYRLYHAVYLYLRLKLQPPKPVGPATKNTVGATSFIDQDSNYADTCGNSSSDVLNAINQTSSILSVMNYESGDCTDRYLSSMAYYLSVYVEAVLSTISCTSTSGDGGSGVVSIEQLDSLNKYGNAVSQMACDKEYPTSIRYHLHFIELALFIDALYVSKQFTAVAATPESRSQVLKFSIFTSEASYSMMQSMQRVVTSYGSSSIISSDSDSLKSIRLKLLQLVSSTIIESNAMNGKLSKEKEEVARSVDSMKYRNNYKYSSYDLLTGNFYHCDT